MAVGREQLAREIAMEIIGIYHGAELEISQEIARRLAKDIEAPDWLERKQAEVVKVRRKAQAEALKLNKTLRVTDEKIQGAYRAGSQEAAAEMGSFFAPNPAVIQAIATERVTMLRSAHFQILRQSTDAFRSIIAEANTMAVTGVDTRRTAAKRALNRFSEKGITRFVDKAGKNWKLSSYAEMAIRTGSMNAQLQGRFDQYLANGRDLVIISDAPGECERCRSWEGKVLSITGGTAGKLDRGFRVAGTLSEAKSAGLFHPGCRHDARPYIEGLTKRHKNTQDPEGDAARQKQRYYERQIREKKERVATDQAWLEGDNSPDSKAALAKSQTQLRASQEKLKTHIEDNDLKRLPYREQIKSAI